MNNFIFRTAFQLNTIHNQSLLECGRLGQKLSPRSMLEEYITSRDELLQYHVLHDHNRTTYQQIYTPNNLQQGEVLTSKLKQPITEEKHAVSTTEIEIKECYKEDPTYIQLDPICTSLSLIL